MPITATTLFPVAPVDATHDQLLQVLSSLRESIDTLAESQNSPTSSQSTTEIARLQNLVASLESDLESARQQAQLEPVVVDTHVQQLFDNFAASTVKKAQAEREMSFDLITAPARDEEHIRIEGMKSVLGVERDKFTQAAVKLGEERAAIQVWKLYLCFSLFRV